MTARRLCAPDDPEWLDLRRQGVTATDITVIAGLVTWDSPWALYHRKRGDLPEVEQSDRMRLGSWLERSLCLHWRQEKTGRGPLLGPGLYQHPSRLWQLATVDQAVGLFDNRDTLRIGSVLEVKSTSQRDGWGEPGTADVPPRVRAQVLWQMDTLDVPIGHVAVVFTSNDSHYGEFRSYTIREDSATMTDQQQLRAAGLEFYRRMTGELPPPDVDGLTVTTDALKRYYPGGKTEPAQLTQELVDAYDAMAVISRTAKADYQRTVNDVRAAMGDADVGEIDGREVFRRSFSKVEGYTVAPYERDMIRRVSDGS